MTQLPRPFAFHTRSLRAPLLGASVALLLTACGATVESDQPAGESIVLGQARVQLTRAETCDGLLASIQDSAVAHLRDRVAEIRQAGANGYYGYDDVLEGGGIPAPGADPVLIGGDGAAPTEQTAVRSTDNTASEQTVQEERPRGSSQNGNSINVDNDESISSGSFSGTTVQVADVDEADIIKTDGDRLYVLHGGTLLAVKAWPADETSILASAVVEGEPIEMFVHEGRAVVFSRIYKNLTAEADENSAVDESVYYGRDYTSYTKITVLEVSGDSEPGVVRESYIEGNYISARRHDGLVRAVIQDGFKVPSLGSPNVEFRDPFGNAYPQADIDEQLNAWSERMERSIRATEIGTWLPREYSREGNIVESVEPRCGNYYTPDAGLTENGVTSVVALDLDNLSGPLGGATILGRAERVYSNKDVLVVTQTDYRWRFNEDVSPEQTVLHRFDIDGSQTAYTASGTVPGRIHNQFSLDERNGVIRVSTTEERWQRFDEGDSDVSLNDVAAGGGFAGGEMMGTSMTTTAPAPQDNAPTEQEMIDEPDLDNELDPATDNIIEGRPFEALPAPTNGPVNRVITLQTSGSELVQLGATDEFGATERIYATRFMGDRAYVVTFRRTDPLFVVDLEDDGDPKVVGELHIPGFSDYLYPLGDDHLFAIGQDADADGRVRGLALQIFDVSDATTPTRVHHHVYEDSGSSPANIDHRAISFHSNGEVIAFPYQNYQTGAQSLDVFGVSPVDGIEPLGSVNPSQEVDISACLARLGYDPGFIEELENDLEWQQEFRYQCQSSQGFRRSVFRDNFVYGIGTGGISVYGMDSLEGEPVSSLMLPAIEYYDSKYDTEPGPAVPGRTAPSGFTDAAPSMDNVVDDTDIPTNENEADIDE